MKIKRLLTIAVLLGSPTTPVGADISQNAVAAKKPAAIRFAVAGFVDLDDDGISDMDLLRRMAAMNGGVIDATMNARGQLTGQLGPDTSFLLVGELPDRGAAAKQLEDFLASAKKKRIRAIPIDQLLRWGNAARRRHENAASAFRQRREMVGPGPDSRVHGRRH